jgi:DNA-binding NarL/FixJ family response regulator
MTRVFLAASSPLLLAGLEAVIATSGTATVVGTASGTSMLESDPDAVEADVLVVALDDLALFPLPLIAESDATQRATPVVLLVGEPDMRRALALHRRGVRAVLAPAASPRELLAAIEAAAAGLIAFPHELAAAAMPAVPRTIADRQPVAAPLALSPRETEILGLVAEGMPNKIVASRLGISEHTVKSHITSILEKLGAESRAEAVAIGARLGIILV